MLKKMMIIGSAFIGFSLTQAPVVQGAVINLEMKETMWELRPGLSTKVWTYGGSIPGQAIILEQGEKLRISGINKLPSTTNIHWHGLKVPNSQDGPSRIIKPSEQYSYEFTANESGTYWYHSHFRPVLDQVDNGLYAPFIVKSREDDLYSGDHILVLDDWYLDEKGNKLEGTARGDMERFGNIETVNGKTGSAIKELSFKQGEIHKLRFINASTAAFHNIKITGHMFRVTHTDGHPLVEPYETTEIQLSPGERIDAEVAAIGTYGQTYNITTDRSELGINIPIIYQNGQIDQMSSPFAPAKSKAIPGIKDKSIDFTLELNSVMDMIGHETPSKPNNGHGAHGAQEKANQTTENKMSWTLNGKSYPNTDVLNVRVGQIVKIRLINKDINTAEKMDHPIHIHGTEFQIVSINGNKPEREIWKDTINVPAGEYIDIAFRINEPGMWMLHCHILDHEDNGMATIINAR